MSNALEVLCGVKEQREVTTFCFSLCLIRRHMLRGICVCVVCVEAYIPHRGLGEALLTHGLLEHLELSLGHRGRCQRKSKGQGQER